jgi:hypothetical protein
MSKREKRVAKTYSALQARQFNELRKVDLDVATSKASVWYLGFVALCAFLLGVNL